MNDNPYNKDPDPFAQEQVPQGQFSQGQAVQSQGLATMEPGPASPSSTAPARTMEPQPTASHAKQRSAVSEDTVKKIMGGFYAALISGTLTLVFTLIATFGEDVTGFLDAWAFLDVALIFGLAVGIFLKSRVAATTMFIYFLASKFYIWNATGKPNGIFMALVFIYFYFQAMMGTFEYHKEKNGG